MSNYEDIDSNKYLYYYCNMETFYNIIKSQKIWLRDLLYMDDTMELFLHHINFAKYVLSEYENDPFEFQFDKFNGRDAIINYLKPYNLFAYTGWDLLWNNKFFALSLTNSDNIPFLWEKYGDNYKGVCIGFDINKINAFIEKNENFYLQKIEYIENFDETIRGVAKTILNYINENKNNTNYLLENIFIPNMIVKEFSRYKTDLYKKEEETRLVYIKKNNKIIPNVNVADIDEKYTDDIEISLRDCMLDLHKEVNIKDIGITKIKLGCLNENSNMNIKLILAKYGIELLNKNICTKKNETLYNVKDK